MPIVNYLTMLKKKALFIIITKTFFELLKTIQKQKKNFFLIYY